MGVAEFKWCEKHCRTFPVDSGCPTCADAAAAYAELGINKAIWEADQRTEESLMTGLMHRNDLFRLAEQMADESLTLLKQRNTEYAQPEHALANLDRYGLLGVMQEIQNCVCRLENYAKAVYANTSKPMSPEQVRNAEVDLLNFAILYRAVRIQLEGK